MEKKAIVNKLIEQTANRIYHWEKYPNNQLSFKHNFFEMSQHFIPSISYVLKVEQGVFLLASFQAMIVQNRTSEEIALLFFTDYDENLEERIDSNSTDLYTLRKLIELNLENIIPKLGDRDSSDTIDDPSDALSNFLKK